MPGAGSFERGVCAGWALLAALERRGLEDGLPVENAPALRMSTFMRGFAGCCGVPRGLSFGPMLGIECRFDSGDDPVYGFARRGTGSAGVNDVVVAVVAGVAGKKLSVVFCVFSFVLADIVGGEPLRDPDVSTTLELDPESLSPKLSLTSFAFPPPETSALRRDPSCTLLAIQIHPYHD